MTTAEPVVREASGAGPAGSTDRPWRLGAGAIQLGLVTGLAGAATSGWLRLGEGPRPALALALGSAAPPALALGASALLRRRWPAWLALPGHLGLVALLAAVLAGGPGAARDTLTGGWARLLSSILPAPPGSEVAVLALVVAAVAAAVGAELALRSRAAVIPVVPALAALVATRMATQGLVGSRLTGAAVALVPLAGALVLARSHVLRLAVGLPLVVAAVAVAAMAGPALPWAEARPPFDPRALRDLPAIEAGAVNPLARLRAWQAAPGQVLFRVALSEPASLRLAVLDRYDGVRFSADPRFTRAGAALPPPPSGDPGVGAPTRTVTADLVIAALEGPWVPAPDRATRVSGPAVAVDPASGVVVAPGGVRPGQRFRVVAAVPTDRLPRLADAAAASPAQAGPAAAVPPELPPELADLATDEAGDPADPPVVRLRRLEELFRTEFREDPSSPPGHSVSRLTAFLAPADRVGSTEQLATAFAVLARSLGYPTRVAVGFQPRLNAGEPSQVEVRGRDARAWPEVALAGAGWVAFDPTPNRGAAAGAGGRAPEAEAAVATPSPPVPPRPPEPGTRTPPSETTAHHGRSWRPVAVAGTTAVLLLGLLLGGVVLGKRWRRSGRSRATDPGVRVRGAWAEASDRLVERGLGRPAWRTPRDAVSAVAEVSRAARGPLADLGDLAERAAFAGPGAVADPDADRAWADLHLLEAALAADDGRLNVFCRMVDPRSLVPNR